MDNQIHVFFACDDNFVKFTYVTLTSIMENSSKDYFYNFYVLNTGISDKMKEASTCPTSVTILDKQSKGLAAAQSTFNLSTSLGE